MRALIFCIAIRLMLDGGIKFGKKRWKLKGTLSELRTFESEQRLMRSGITPKKTVR